MAHLKQERYSDVVLKLARKAAVTNEFEIFSTDYEGSPKAGIVKIPTRATEVSVGDYSTTAGKAPAGGTTTYTSITIGNDKAVNEIIDGYEAAALPDGLVAQRLDSAAYSLGNTVDADGIGVLESEGTTSASTTQSTTTTAYGLFMTDQTALDLADIPRDGRFAILSPQYYNVVKQNVIANSKNGLADDVIMTGRLGTLDGVPVYMSNNVAADTEFILGHMGWCQRVMEWTVPIGVVDLYNEFIGASAVQGRYVFEHSVTKATAVRVKTYA
jgi:hypothetical protein